MKKLKKTAALLAAAFVIFAALTSCDSAAGNPTQSDSSSDKTVGTAAATKETASEASGTADITSADTQTSSSETSASASEDLTAAHFTGYDTEVSDKDKNNPYIASDAVKIVFSEKSAKITGTGASATGADVTITAKGTYMISGSCSDGSITVETDKETKVQLVLSGLTLTNADGPAVYVKAADKVFITLADGTVNSLSDSKSNNATDGTTGLDAAVYSKDDLTVNGSGSLTVTGAAAHGIVSKNDLIITNGTLSVTSVKTALRGKDSVKITGGSITINAGTDGIKSDNDSEQYRGFVYISDGSVKITAGSDDIQTENGTWVAGGSVTISHKVSDIKGGCLKTGGSITEK